MVKYQKQINTNRQSQRISFRKYNLKSKTVTILMEPARENLLAHYEMACFYYHMYHGNTTMYSDTR